MNVFSADGTKASEPPDLITGQQCSFGSSYLKGAAGGQTYSTVNEVQEYLFFQNSLSLDILRGSGVSIFLWAHYTTSLLSSQSGNSQDIFFLV